MFIYFWFVIRLSIFVIMWFIIITKLYTFPYFLIFLLFDFNFNIIFLNNLNALINRMIVCVFLVCDTSALRKSLRNKIIILIFIQKYHLRVLFENKSNTIFSVRCWNQWKGRHEKLMKLCRLSNSSYKVHNRFLKHNIFLVIWHRKSKTRMCIRK